MGEPRRPGPVRALLALAAVVLAASSSFASAPSVAAMTPRDVRLEAGLQTGIRFSSTGAILARKAVTYTAKAIVKADRRRVVPNRTGIFLRITTGALAGYEVRESPVAYIPGKVGDVAYVPAATVRFPAGRYLGYAFETDWSLATAQVGVLSTSTVATASRRAVINGRPYVRMESGSWSGRWIPVTRARSLDAQGLTCEVPAKVAGGTSAVLRRVSTTERKVALTFDMGGRLTPARDIVERLILDRVCATIFPTGDSIATVEGAAVMALIASQPALFEVGNHTQNHCNLRDGGGPTDCPSTPPTTARIQWELQTAEASIRADGPRPCARPASALWRLRHPRPDGGGRRRIHEDDHVGHRHDRLEADPGRRPHHLGHRGEGGVERAAGLDRAHAPGRLSHVRRASVDGRPVARGGAPAVHRVRPRPVSCDPIRTEHAVSGPWARSW
jgi:hypothetical protein